MLDKKYTLRRECMSMTPEKWKIINQRFSGQTIRISVNKMIEKVGLISMMPAKANNEENEFIELLYSEFARRIK